MKKTRLGTYVIYILFMLGVILGFFYTLAMLTDVTTLSFYQDFLDPSVKPYLDAAQATNVQLFNGCLVIVVASIVTFFIRYRRGKPGIISHLLGFFVGTAALVMYLISYREMVALNEFYAVTDTEWPEAIAGLAELLGFVQPGNFWVGSGPTLYLVLWIVSLLYALVSLAWVISFVVRRKVQ
jgi:uncharacterized membrane protein required for colicin V production